MLIVGADAYPEPPRRESLPMYLKCTMFDSLLIEACCSTQGIGILQWVSKQVTHSLAWMSYVAG